MDVKVYLETGYLKSRKLKFLKKKYILVVCFSDWVLKDYTNKRVCVVGTHEKAIGRNKLLAQDVMNII